MKVLLTGSSGFIGTNLYKYLTDFKIQVLTLSLRGDWIQNFDGSVNAIIHLAGKAHDLKNTKGMEYFEINTKLTVLLFKEFLKSEAKDFIYFSSIKAVADSSAEVVTEETVATPKTSYGRSKYEAERYLMNQKLPKNKRLIIIRPCMVHGPGNKGNLNLLFNLVSKGLPWPLGNFENKRSFLSIYNLSYLVLQILRNPSVNSGIYNISDDEVVSTNDLIRLMNNSLGKDTKLLFIPINIINFFSKVGDILHLPINSEKLKKLTESFVVSNSKIKSAIGIEKMPLTATEGFIETLKSLKDK